MNIFVPLIISAFALLVGIIFALFPRWWMDVVCHCARSYMNEDLSSDPSYVLAFRFYGIAATGLGLYALYQVLRAL
jgi:uncharacterized membrane protein YedE/YeeE